jgi:signal transduction histidine kinase
VIRRFLASYGEFVLVFGLGLLAQIELWLDGAWAADRNALSIVALGMTGALLLRLRAPIATLLLESAGLQAVVALNTARDDDPMTLVIMVVVALYSAGAHTRGRALLAGSIVVVGLIVVTAIQDGSSINVSGFLFYGFFIGGPFLAGVAMRVRRERERLLVHERDARARTAVAEERTRIARELHDVVAHAVSVIVLQARGGRRALGHEPAETRAALDAIEATASQALAEMRRLLEMLRTDDEALALAPQPSLVHLDALADQVREAGLPVEVAVEGERRDLPTGVDVSAYRIVQEALTNALKHAGPAHARVRVRYGAEELELEVVDTGAGGGNGDGAGHGLVGMRERASLFGGDVDAGPLPGGGFAVRARLPL